MALLSTAVARQPALFQKRFGNTYWVNWMNSLLQRLSSEDLLPITDKETGVIVQNDVWIKKPSGCRYVKKIYNPENRWEQYNWVEVEDKIKLTDVEIDDYSGTALTVFSSYTTTSINANVTGQALNAYKNFLFYITAGTYADKGFILSGNDVSGVSDTKLNFLHTLASALSGTRVTAAQLISYEYYLMMEYAGTLESVAAVTDEIPFEDQYEQNVVDAWLRWNAEKNTSESIDNARAYKNDFEDVFRVLKRERRRQLGGPIKGRSMPDFRYKANGKYKYMGDYTHKD